jgi:uncharacterized protein YjiS (DUF1127 family)
MTAIHLGIARRPLFRVRGPSALRSASNVAARLLERPREWRRRVKGRAELAALDDHMLADIGISRAEAKFLSNKPFWRE